MDRTEFERYQAFMVGYVNRINKATLGVTIGGIRIGTAKYSRLAQINLKSRIITFSRFAIENVPERGRRYLVLHELAHVKEANHTQRFWDIVSHHEPQYKQIGHSLDQAFKKNVREYQKQLKQNNSIISEIATKEKTIVMPKLMTYKMDAVSATPELDEISDSYECMENEFDAWDESMFGTLSGGSESEFDTANGGATF